MERDIIYRQCSTTSPQLRSVVNVPNDSNTLSKRIVQANKGENCTRERESKDKSYTHQCSRSRSNGRDSSHSYDDNRNLERSYRHDPSRRYERFSSNRNSSRDRSLSREIRHYGDRSRSSEKYRSRSKRGRYESDQEQQKGKYDRDQTNNFAINQTFFQELINTLRSNQTEDNKFPILGDVLPEFDPLIKGQTITTWLHKVEECARLYNWSSDQIIHYALPKLTGVARSWYQTLPSMAFTWPEWKRKLVESFPSIEDYAELITEMLSKRVKYNESLELYYYGKVSLLNRCKIFGKRAVDCLLHGVDDRSVRLGAKAAKCLEPEQVLHYFQSIKQQLCESDRSHS